MNSLTAIAFALLLIASYLATLNLAMIKLSRSDLQRRLETIGRSEAPRWLLDHSDDCSLVTSLLRSLFRVAFFCIVLLDFVGLDGKLTVSDMIIASLISAAALWLCSSVIAAAIARHAGTVIVVRSMWVLRGMTLVGMPLGRMLSFVDEIVRRLSGADPNGDDAGADLLRSIEDTQLEGGLDRDAVELLGNVVEFGTTDVGEVMTPRTDIDGIEMTDDLAEIRRVIMDVGHSRLPVYEGSLDNIKGVVYVKDLLPYLGTDASDFKLEPILRQPIIIPETKPVRELLADFQQAEVHMGVVIDEYGGTAGLVTIEDILEELVGEIHDEHEPDTDEDPTCNVIDEKNAEVDGRYHIDDLNEQFDLDLPEDEEFDTIAGFMLSQFGRVPSVGDSFESHRVRFTAMETTPTHVRKIKLQLLSNGANGKFGNGHA